MSHAEAIQLGQYTILEQIGKGGMSNVYRATQASIGREVAVKIMLGALVQQDESFRERFYREVQVAAKLQHPHILPVYDFGEHDGHPYIVMAYVRGGSLADRISQGPMSLSEVQRVVGQVAVALDFAHGTGVIHRDFKPSNVLLDENGNTYLTDFGLAKVSDAALQLTGSALLGTPDYMAPDLATSPSISQSVDIYALGVTLFQMLSGHVPYRASTPMGVLMAHLSTPVPDIRSDRPDLPEALQQVIMTAMAKSAADRYPTAGALAEAIRAAAKEPQHTPHALLFIDMQGQVIFVNQSLLRLIEKRESEVRSVIGRPLNEVLGFEAAQTRALIQDVSRIGRVYDRPLRLPCSNGTHEQLLLTAEATYDEKGVCVGADLSLRSVSEGGAQGAFLSSGSASLDTGERIYLQLYFSSQFDALRVLLVRLGGARLGKTLDRIVNETSARSGWPVQINEGRLEIDALRVEPHVFQGLLAKTVAYVVTVIGPAMVRRQMQSVEDQLGERSVQLANQLGMREVLLSD